MRTLSEFNHVTFKGPQHDPPGCRPSAGLLLQVALIQQLGGAAPVPAQAPGPPKLRFIRAECQHRPAGARAFPRRRAGWRLSEYCSRPGFHGMGPSPRRRAAGPRGAARASAQTKPPGLHRADDDRGTAGSGALARDSETAPPGGPQLRSSRGRAGGTSRQSSRTRTGIQDEPEALRVRKQSAPPGDGVAE